MISSSATRIEQSPQRIEKTETAERIERARRAQTAWARTALSERLKHIRQIRFAIAADAERLARSIDLPQRARAADSLAAEVLPVADACRFLEREATRLLSPRRLRRRSRPAWAGGVDVELHREPYGVVLIVGAWNYPLLLAGVQALQAVAAGNAVLLKPAEGAEKSAALLADLMQRVDLPADLIQVLPSDPVSAERAMEAGVDKVVLTGSAPTGRAVQRQLAETLTPSTLELSGCDAVFVREDADLDRLVQCLVFGLQFNAAATCIAPRRVFVPRSLTETLETRLTAALEDCPPLPVAQRSAASAVELAQEAVDTGARVVTGALPDPGGDVYAMKPLVLADCRPEMRLLQSDIFAPVTSLVPVDGDADALEADEACPFALGASVFGTGPEARRLAERVNAGCLVINDLVGPTADPRVPFGGRKQSGFGMTRGGAGLEEMTQIKAIITQRARRPLHLMEPADSDEELLAGLIVFLHGHGLNQRLQGALRSARALWRRVRSTATKENGK